MKKFKLIQEYPGSPEIGFTISFKPGYDYITTGTFRFSLDECVKYPKYWQEIFELPINTVIKDPDTDIHYIKTDKGWFRHNDSSVIIDESLIGSKYIVVENYTPELYKIRSFINKIGCMYYLNDNGYYDYSGDTKPAFWRTKNYLLTCENVKIHSVTRLSDNMTFTIGDNVTVFFNEGSVITNKIHGFYIDYNDVYISTSIDKLYAKLICDYYICVITPLFTTYDGVHVYKDTVVHCVNEKYEIIENAYHKYDQSLTFHDLEKAKEYVLLNKPCLSINDVAKVYVTANQFPVDKPNAQGNRLKELVKTKLQL